MTDEQQPGASIAEVFPPESVEARFVLSMAMAKNDIERALRDVLRAGANNDPDFSYRVRLLTGHLVEGIEAFNAYSERYEEVRALVARLPNERRQAFRTVRGAFQQAGRDVLQHIRQNTFHYPSPDPTYSPTSDEQLEEVLSTMGNRRAEIHINREARHATLTFADDVALALAMNRHAPTDEDARRQLEVARDAALAFRAWGDELVLVYLDSVDAYPGDPEWEDGGENAGGTS
jgi:hypothetical protein